MKKLKTLIVIASVFLFSCVTTETIVDNGDRDTVVSEPVEVKIIVPINTESAGHLVDLSYSDLFTDIASLETGFMVHYQYGAYIPEAINMYSIGGSNWKYQDANSLFVRYMGDKSTYDRNDLYFGIEDEKLEELTEELGVVYWMPYPSLLFISAKDQSSMDDAMKNDEVLNFMIKKLAYNTYEDGSWFNLLGRDTGFDTAEHDAYLINSRATGSSANKSNPYVFDIDYSNPELYLQSGPRSILDEDKIVEMIADIEAYVRKYMNINGPVPKTVQGAFAVQRWLNNNYKQGGPMDITLEVDDYYDIKLVGGCTSNALVLATALRAVGIPAVYIYTVDIPTARQTPSGREISNGHQMIEAYVDGKWILLDGNGRYIDDYDTTNPYIYRVNENGRVADAFVIAKGLDSWDCGYVAEDGYANMSTLFINNLKSGNLDNYLANPAVYEMK